MRRLISLALMLSALLLTSFAQTAKPRTALTIQPDGLTAQSNGVHLLVKALRDDVLRIRYWRGTVMPEDASWTVLSAPRKSSAHVTALPAHRGFSTSAMTVEVDPRDLRLTIRDRQGRILQQDSAPIEFRGTAFTLTQAMTYDSHYFGLGDKTGGLDRREQAFKLWNTDAYLFQESTDPLYKSIPFFMTYDSGRAIGTLLDNTWCSHFDFGRTRRNTFTFGAVSGPVDYYVLYGPSPKQVLDSYAWLTGPTPLPPLWSLGFQQSRYSYMTQADVEQIAKRLRDDKIPADAIYLDIDYQDRNRPFTVNREAFPDFAGMVRTLHQQGIRVVAITDLHIANAPKQNYSPYDSGIASDHFVHNPNGSVYTGEVWPGPAVFPDFTQDEARQWWGTLYKDFVGSGVDGFWNDMNEPAIFNTPLKTMPDDTVHRIEGSGFHTRTATHAEIHNVFGMQNARGTEEGLLKLRPNERPFVLTRAAFAGAHRYAATWTGDNSSTWNHLRMSTQMIKNLGLSGYSMTGADVGGFIGNPSPELLTKWIEIAAFQPIDRDHTEKGSADQEVWVHGPEHEAIRRHYIEERYRLLPYLYTTAEENVRTGLPIVRPLFLEFPDAVQDKHPLDLDREAANEFLFGPDLLIAPPQQLEQTVAYDVLLPGDGWYDYWSGKRVTAKPAPKVTPELSVLPIYVRPGTILPYAPLTQSTSERPNGPLTLRVYAGQDCHGSIYSDDGHTFDYQKGQFLRVSFTCDLRSDGSLALHIGAHQGTYPAWWSQLKFEVFGLNFTAPKAWVDSRTPVGATVQNNVVEFTLPDDGKGLDLTIGQAGHP